MKKYFVITLSLILVLGFAASALAIHAEIPSETQAVVSKGSTQITLGGELRMRGWYTDDIGTARVSATQGTDEVTQIWYDTDLDNIIDANERWSIRQTDTSDLVVSPTMFLPSNQSVVASFIRTRSNAYNTIAVDVVTDTTSVARIDSKSDAWYDARVRLTLKAEVTPNTTGYVALESNSGSTTSDSYAWGTLNQKQSDLTILEAWIQHTGSGLLGVPAGIKVGHMPLSLGEKQFLDLTKFGTDAVVLFADPIKGLHVAALTAKVVEGSNSVNDDVDAYVALMTYKINDKNTIGANYTWIKGDDLNAIGLSDYSLKFNNYMVHAKGSAGPLSYRAEVDYQLGRVVEGDGETTKVEAFGIFAELGLKVDPVTVFARYGYGSGDKGTEGKNEDFQTILGRDLHSTWIYEYMIDGAASNQIFPSGSTTSYRSRGLANTSMFNIGATMSPAKDVTVSLDAFYLRANAAYKGQKNPMSNWYNTSNETSRNIGWEADLKVNYKIDRNLTYGVIAGIFKPGSYYRSAYDMKEMGIKMETVKAIRHTLTLSF